MPPTQVETRFATAGRDVNRNNTTTEEPVTDTGKELERLLSEVLLSAPQPKDFADLYITGAGLQFRSHFRAAHVLLRSEFDVEAWILIRSMSELLIRTKWVKRNKSNAVWIILGTETKDLNRFKSQKERSKLKTKAIQSIERGLNEVKPRLQRNARYWNSKSPSELASLPSIETMAKECGLLKTYRTWFKFGSDHTHSSHRTLERFMATDQKGNLRHWILDPPPADLSVTRYRLNCIAVGYLGCLLQFGWRIDKTRLEEITKEMDRSSIEPT